MNNDAKQEDFETVQLLITVKIPTYWSSRSRKMILNANKLVNSLGNVETYIHKIAVVSSEQQLLHTINAASEAIYQANKKQGFWTDGVSRNFGEMLMLVTSELGEAMEAHRKDKAADWKAYNSVINATPEDATEAEKLLLQRQAFVQYIKDSWEDEISDAIIRLLDMAGGLGIDLFKHINAKLQYNASRPRLHGKTY